MVHTLEYRRRDEVITRVFYDLESRSVISVENNKNVPEIFWMMPEDGDFNFLLFVLSNRILPEERYIRFPEGQMACGSIDYDPFKICKYTHGVAGNDAFWIWFDTDKPDLRYDDIKIRKNC